MRADLLSRPFIVGASGQMARALVAVLGEHTVTAGRNRLDLAEPALIRDRLDNIWRDESPTCVVNAAAYTEVDRAESEPALANAVNAAAPGEIALWCKSRSIPFVHYSTDYVYDGSGSTAWIETAPSGPLSAYGRSKRDGDEAVINTGGDWLILRTSWLYDQHGKNFLRTILRLGAEREELAIVGDQYGAPTYAPHLAMATMAAIQGAAAQPVFPSGVFHLCARGETTWHGFATAALALAAQRGLPLKVRRIREITAAEYPTPARRPLNSRLDTTKAEAVLGVVIPDWRRGLDECVQAISPLEASAVATVR